MPGKEIPTPLSLSLISLFALSLSPSALMHYTITTPLYERAGALSTCIPHCEHTHMYSPEVL